MVKTALKAFNGALDLTYKGARKLFWVVVGIAVVASCVTVLAIATLAAVLR
jgi:hypothetical protein